jgi:hypothetical protein
MAEESANNSLPTNPLIDDDTGSDFGVKSTTMTTSSPPTCGASLMAKGEIPELTDFLKKQPSPRKNDRPSMTVAGYLVA